MSEEHILDRETIEEIKHDMGQRYKAFVLPGFIFAMFTMILTAWAMPTDLWWLQPPLMGTAAYVFSKHMLEITQEAKL